MTKDNGKVRIEIKDGVPIIDVYHNGEIELADVVWINHLLLNEIDPPLQLPADIIVDRTGSYSLSEDAYMMMKELMSASGRVAYVVHSKSQEVMVNLAANSYLANKKVCQFNSIEEAFAWLQESI
ncbi:MAG: STAS/SEC14 domain-containing protein [Chromatiales bacterium]|nr:STAS/SEC14 domain-containing protein [Chromatiales bacterium]